MNKVEYLSKIASILPNSSDKYVLKSYYLTRCWEIEDARNPEHGAKVKRFNQCPKCCIAYAEEATLYKISPQQRSNRFRRRLLKGIEKSKALTKYQECYAKRMNGNSFLEIKCGVCKHIVKREFKKPEQDNNNKKQEIDTIPVHHKKKRKKDKLAGLNKEAVLSVTPNLIKTPAASPAIKNDIKTSKFHHLKDKRLMMQLNKKHKVAERKAKNKMKVGIAHLSNALNAKKSSTPSNTLKLFLQNL